MCLDRFRFSLWAIHFWFWLVVLCVHRISYMSTFIWSRTCTCLYDNAAYKTRKEVKTIIDSNVCRREFRMVQRFEKCLNPKNVYMSTTHRKRVYTRIVNFPDTSWLWTSYTQCDELRLHIIIVYYTILPIGKRKWRETIPTFRHDFLKQDGKTQKPGSHPFFRRV
jgi:hypothetical protein